MPSVSQRGKREVEKFIQSVLVQSERMEHWALGNYTQGVSFSPSGREVTLTLTLLERKPTGSPTSGSGGKAKAGRGAGFGSRPGKGLRGGASRGD